MAEITFDPVSVPTLDDEDIFQCGKCKTQFNSFNNFVNHKKEACQARNVEIVSKTSFLPDSTLSNAPELSLPRNFVLMKASGPINYPNFTFASDTSSQGAVVTNQVLNETDLLSLTLDNVATLSNLQPLTTSSSTLTQQSTSIGKTSEPFVIQDIPVQNSANSIGLSLLSGGLLSSGLVLTSQGISAAGTKLVFSISTPVPDENDELITSGAVEIEKPESENVQPPVDETSAYQVVSIISEPTKDGKVKSGSTSSSKTKSTEPNTGRKGVVKSAQRQDMKCTFCDKSFSKNFDLQQHVRSHTGEKPFQCIICGRAFAQKSNVKKHIQTHKVWPDGLCSTLPSSVSSNEPKSVEQTTNDTETTDELADVSTSDIASDEVKVDSSYACPYCTFSGKTYFELKAHMKEHKNKKVFKCILVTCAQLYEDLDTFLEHVKTHESEMTYYCHLCSKTFQTLYALGVHQYSHSLYPNKSPQNFKKTFHCSSCLNKYSTSTALDHHKATCSHNYSCPQCNKSFPCERYLRRHLSVHSNRTSYACSICSKSFKAGHYLRIHKLIHTGEKPFTCPHCKTSFNRNDKLKRHLLIHEPLKKFKCPFRTHSGCQKEFNRPDKLKAHVLTHGQSRPFFCKICGRSFKRRTQLNAHQVQHEEEKDFPFQCKDCGSGFLNHEVYESHVCVRYPKYKWRTDTRKSPRTRRSRYNIIHSRKTSAKQAPEEEAVEEPQIEDDGIPTAHIEIISTTGDLGQVSELSQISLQLHPIVETTKDDNGMSTTVIQCFPV